MRGATFGLSSCGCDLKDLVEKDIIWPSPLTHQRLGDAKRITRRSKWQVSKSLDRFFCDPPLKTESEKEDEDPVM